MVEPAVAHCDASRRPPCNRGEHNGDRHSEAAEPTSEWAQCGSDANTFLARQRAQVQWQAQRGGADERANGSAIQPQPWNERQHRNHPEDAVGDAQ